MLFQQFFFGFSVFFSFRAIKKSFLRFKTEIAK